MRMYSKLKSKFRIPQKWLDPQHYLKGPDPKLSEKLDPETNIRFTTPPGRMFYVDSLCQITISDVDSAVVVLRKPLS
jgi:hypothetical protein